VIANRDQRPDQKRIGSLAEEPEDKPDEKRQRPQRVMSALTVGMRQRSSSDGHFASAMQKDQMLLCLLPARFWTDWMKPDGILEPDRLFCSPRLHAYDEYMLVLQGCYTPIIFEEWIPISAGMEYLIPGGTPGKLSPESGQFIASAGIGWIGRS
jgi:hypothetical protein